MLGGCLQEPAARLQSLVFSLGIAFFLDLTDRSVAAMGGSYEFVRFASANLREKDDSLNPALGGFVAGSVLGLRCQRLFHLWT